MEKEQFEGLYGPRARYSEQEIGDEITFRTQRGDVTDFIVWVQPEGTTAGGRHHPLVYIMSKCDPDTGLPYTVYPNQILV